MATSSRRPAPKGNIKTGICENHNYLNPDTGETGICPKCASGEKIKVNVQRISDFRCPVCGEKLKPIKTGPGVMTYVYIGLAVIVVVALIWLVFGGKSDNNDSKDTETSTIVKQPQVTDSDSIKELVVEEPVAATDTKEVKEDDGKNGKDSEKVTHQPQPQSKGVLGGAATMSTQNGIITIKFKRPYSLDLGKTDGSTLEIGAGDEIYMANVRNGFLFGGQYKAVNGEEKNLSGIKVRL